MIGSHVLAFDNNSDRGDNYGANNASGTVDAFNGATISFASLSSRSGPLE